MGTTWTDSESSSLPTLTLPEIALVRPLILRAVTNLVACCTTEYYLFFFFYASPNDWQVRSPASWAICWP